MPSPSLPCCNSHATQARSEPNQILATTLNCPPTRKFTIRPDPFPSSNPTLRQANTSSTSTPLSPPDLQLLLPSLPFPSIETTSSSSRPHRLTASLSCINDHRLHVGQQSINSIIPFLPFPETLIVSTLELKSQRTPFGQPPPSPYLFAFTTVCRLFISTSPDNRPYRHQKFSFPYLPSIRSSLRRRHRVTSGGPF